MLECSLQAIGLSGPGLSDWDSARAVLRGDLDWVPTAVEWPRPALLPAKEHRRVTPMTRLVLGTVQQVLGSAVIDPMETPSVFATAGGELEIAQKICRILLIPDRPISPVMFSNSVHNATAGYFSIASGSRRVSTTIAAGSVTAAAGLLEAALIARSEQRPTLLAVYDAAPAEPLANCVKTIADMFAAALLIGPTADGGRSLYLSIGSTATGEDRLPEELRQLASRNPAAALLPLLSLAAGDVAGSISLPRQAGAMLHVELGHA